MVTKKKSEIYIEFSKRLVEACEKHGLKKERGPSKKVGQLAGIGYKGAEKWLNGQGMPDMGHAVALANALNVSFDWLMAGQGTKVPAHGARDSVLWSALSGKYAGKEPMYPTEPFNRFGRLAQLWPYLTDEAQENILGNIERIVKAARHGLPPPSPPLKKMRNAKDKVSAS